MSLNEETLNIIIAVTLASSGSIVQAIGYVIQKKAHNNVNAVNITITDAENKKSILSSFLWMVGLFTSFLGAAMMAAALKWGAQSVVVPLESLTLVANTILATKYLGKLTILYLFSFMISLYNSF